MRLHDLLKVYFWTDLHLLMSPRPSLVVSNAGQHQAQYSLNLVESFLMQCTER